MRHAVLAAGIAMAFGLTASACGGGDQGTTKPPASPTATAPAAPVSEGYPTDDDLLFGAGCAKAVPPTGPGSSQSMEDQPVATAISRNPSLSTLASAVQKAGLTETLNSADDITVFAPTNDAFAAIPEAQLNELLADRERLASLLKYHVVQGDQEPSDLASGSFQTLQGGTLTTSGSGDDYTVGDAKVVCGNVQTENADVYLIDKVLTPPQ